MDESRLFRFMQENQGELRVKAGRHGGGWLAAGCALTPWTFDDQWNALNADKKQYEQAIDFFKAVDTVVVIEHAESAQKAHELCVRMLCVLARMSLADEKAKINDKEKDEKN